MKKKDTKADIIALGTEMISLQGYNATGIDAVLKKAGVPKGSFYHYFGSKEDFGLAVIDQFAVHYEEKLAAFFDDETVPPLHRIRNYLENGFSHLVENGFTKGCLAGNIGQEMADQNEVFRSRIDRIFRSWKERFSVCLGEAGDAGDLDPGIDPDALAEFVLSGWEGAVLRAKVMRSQDPLKDFIDILFGTVLKGR
jgi:TetR/AcrR family transcriptional repressor of nem operon